MAMVAPASGFRRSTAVPIRRRAIQPSSAPAASQRAVAAASGLGSQAIGRPRRPLISELNYGPEAQDLISVRGPLRRAFGTVSNLGASRRAQSRYLT